MSRKNALWILTVQERTSRSRAGQYLLDSTRLFHAEFMHRPDLPVMFLIKMRSLFWHWVFSVCFPRVPLWLCGSGYFKCQKPCSCRSKTVALQHLNPCSVAHAVFLSESHHWETSKCRVWSWQWLILSCLSMWPRTKSPLLEDGAVNQ